MGENGFLHGFEIPEEKADAPALESAWNKQTVSLNYGK
jgi:hypothetical protein